MKVLFVSPEVNPLVHTGGLGDVVGSLPLALSGLGVDVRIICPLHRVCLPTDSILLQKPLKIKLNDLLLQGNLRETRLKGSKIPIYLIDLPKLYDRPGVYSDESGDFPDNAQRAFALCQAALQVENITGWRPEVVHAHDWMAAALPAYVNDFNERNESSSPIRSVLTIHNLQHQGVFSYDDFESSGLPNKYWGMEGFESHGSLNLLKGGIQHADKITTVSPTYAEEIRTSEFGYGLETSLQFRAADLIGILNGIDEASWNPLQDPALPHPIQPNRPKAGKLACKSALLQELGMSSNLEVPLFGVVSRLYEQKGLDLLIDLLPQVMAESHATFAFLGSGNPGEEEALRELSAAFPERIGCFIGFDDGLARRIFAGSDFFIMPSRFEPCGLAQQYAMRYGSLPIARRTGGLADTIRPVGSRQKSPDGFLFSQASAQDLWKALKSAMEVYANPRKFSRIRKNALNRPCSWKHAAEKYLQIYGWASASN